MPKIDGAQGAAQSPQLDGAKSALSRGELLSVEQGLALSHAAKAAQRDGPQALERLGREVGASAHALEKLTSLSDLNAEYEARKASRRMKPFGELVRLEQELRDAQLVLIPPEFQRALAVSKSARDLSAAPRFAELQSSTLPLDAQEAREFSPGLVSVAELVSVGKKTGSAYPKPHVASLLCDGHPQLTIMVRAHAQQDPPGDTSAPRRNLVLKRNLLALDEHVEASVQGGSRLAPGMIADRVLTLQSFSEGAQLALDLAKLSASLKQTPALSGIAPMLDPLFDRSERPHLSLYQDTSSLHRDLHSKIGGLLCEAQAALRLTKAGWKILALGLRSIDGQQLKEGGKGGSMDRQSRREIDILAVTPSRQVAFVEVKKSEWGVIKSAYDTDSPASREPLGEDGQLLALGKLSTREDVSAHIEGLAHRAGLSLAPDRGPIVMHLIPENPLERRAPLASEKQQSLRQVSGKFMDRFNPDAILSLPQYELCLIDEQGGVRRL